MAHQYADLLASRNASGRTLYTKHATAREAGVGQETLVLRKEMGAVEYHTLASSLGDDDGVCQLNKKPENAKRLRTRQDIEL